MLMEMYCSYDIESFQRFISFQIMVDRMIGLSARIGPITTGHGLP